MPFSVNVKKFTYNSDFTLGYLKHTFGINLQDQIEDSGSAIKTEYMNANNYS